MRAGERGAGPPAVVLCDKLSDKIKTFVSEHVHALERAAKAAGFSR